MPCTASEWNKTARSRVIFPISSSGCTVPISLFASITLTRIVFSVMAFFTSAGSTRPSFATPRYVTSYPCLSRRLQVSRIALCSVTVVMMWLPLSL